MVKYKAHGEIMFLSLQQLPCSLNFLTYTQLASQTFGAPRNLFHVDNTPLTNERNPRTESVWCLQVGHFD
jgi:hypothetical protein